MVVLKNLARRKLTGAPDRSQAGEPFARCLGRREQKGVRRPVEKRSDHLDRLGAEEYLPPGTGPSLALETRRPEDSGFAGSIEVHGSHDAQLP
jgi:hypothetical protein